MTGKQIRQFGDASLRIDSIAISPDGTILATGDSKTDQGSAVRLWEVGTGRLIRTLAGHKGAVESLAFSGQGNTLASGSSDGSAQTWDVKSGRRLQIFSGHTSLLQTSVLSADRGSLLVGSENGNAVLWDLKTGKPIQRLIGHTDAVLSAALSRDGRFALTGSEDRTARLWDLQTGRELRRFESEVVTFNGMHTSGPISGVAFSPDGSKVLVGTSYCAARVFDTLAGVQVQQFLLPSGSLVPPVLAGDINAMSFSPDGSLVLTASGDGIARVWSVATGKEVQQFRAPPLYTGAGAISVNAAVFSPNGRKVLTGSGNDSGESGGYFGHLWDVESGSLLQTFTGHDAPILSVAFSPDGSHIVTGGSDSTARFWDAITGKELQRYVGQTSSVYSVGFSADGLRILTGSMDGSSRVWNAATGVQMASLFSFTDDSWAVSDLLGRYDASDPDNSPSLYWVTDNFRILGIGQLKKEYYTPGLLGRVMRGEHLPDVAGMGLVALPPVVTVAKQFDPATKRLAVEIENDGGGVGRLSVQMGGRLLKTIDKPGTAAEGKSFVLPIDLSDAPFVEGDNAIRITAYEAGNRIESQELVTHYTLAPAAKGQGTRVAEPAKIGKFYAIVVGTSTFGGPGVKNLTFPSKDAQSIATGLQLGAERLYQGKANVWMRVLTSSAKDENLLPTKKNIKAAFDEVHRLARPEDTLVVYLSGHGAMSIKDRDTYYYLTQDATDFDIDAQTDPRVKDRATVSSGELFEWLREPVKTMPLKQVVILDTCAAGALVQDTKLSEKRDIPPDQRRAIELLKDGTGTFILMGSAADQASYEANRYGEGLLTYALLDGMRGAAIKDATRLDVSDWFNRASDRVPELAKSIGGIQRPVIAAPKGRNFPVVMLDRDDREKIPLAVAMPQLLRVVCIDDKLKDGLGLRDPLREELRAVNDASARGNGMGGVSYLDGTDDDMAGALSPRVQYKVTGPTVSVHILLAMGDETVADETMTAATGDTPALAKMVAGKIVAMAVGSKK